MIQALANMDSLESYVLPDIERREAGVALYTPTLVKYTATITHSRAGASKALGVVRKGKQEQVVTNAAAGTQ